VSRSWYPSQLYKGYWTSEDDAPLRSLTDDEKSKLDRELARTREWIKTTAWQPLCLALLCLLLTACAVHPYRTAPGTSVLVVKPPAELTEEVPEPQPKGRDNGALAELADSAIEALREANRRLRKIRDL
jgi:hypothetical protein